MIPPTTEQNFRNSPLSAYFAQIIGVVRYARTNTVSVGTKTHSNFYPQGLSLSVAKISVSGCQKPPDAAEISIECHKSSEILKQLAKTAASATPKKIHRNRPKICLFASVQCQIESRKQIPQSNQRYRLCAVYNNGLHLSGVSATRTCRHAIPTAMSSEAICCLEFYRGLRRTQPDE